MIYKITSDAIQCRISLADTRHANKHGWSSTLLPRDYIILYKIYNYIYIKYRLYNYNIKIIESLIYLSKVELKLINVLHPSITQEC